MEELQLNNSWTFYYLKKEQNVEYADMIHKIGKFSTAEGFWQIYSHMLRPEKLPQNVSLQLFRNDSRAMWEDEEHIKGGDFLIRLPKKQANRLWERLLINLIGEQLPEDINGVVITTRPRFDLLYIWNRTAADPKIRLEIATSLLKLLELPQKNKIDFTSFSPELSGLDPKNLFQYFTDANGEVIEKETPKQVKGEQKDAKEENPQAE